MLTHVVGTYNIQPGYLSAQLGKYNLITMISTNYTGNLTFLFGGGQFRYLTTLVPVFCPLYVSSDVTQCRIYLRHLLCPAMQTHNAPRTHDRAVRTTRRTNRHPRDQQNTAPSHPRALQYTTGRRPRDNGQTPLMQAQFVTAVASTEITGL